MSLIYTVHARLTIDQRGLAEAWVERAVLCPDRTESDSADPDLTRSFRRIAEAGDRIIRVVHRPQGTDILVVTAFLDRRAKL